MGDMFDLLMALAQNNVPVPPAAIIEASYLPLSEKKKLQQMVSTPDPMKQQAMQLGMQEKQADIGKKQAEIGKITSQAQLNQVKAQTEGMPSVPSVPPPPKTPLDVAEQLANINETNATAAHKRASADSMYHKALVTPLQLLADHAQRNADRVQGGLHQSADRVVDTLHRNADRVAQQKQHQDMMAQRVQRAATPE
jgi:hypothetical protein